VPRENTGNRHLLNCHRYPVLMGEKKKMGTCRIVDGYEQILNVAGRSALTWQGAVQE